MINVLTDFTGEKGTLLLRSVENSIEEIKSKNTWKPNVTEPKNNKWQETNILITLKIIKYMYLHFFLTQL